MRSFSGMIALSVMWMCSGQTSSQHFVILQNPIPPGPLRRSVRERMSLGCISKAAMRTIKRGPMYRSNPPWSRSTWQTS